MPSEENITRPISLISRGRSGTSLVMNILKGHPDMIAVGETAQMVFGVWHSLEKSKGIIRPDPILGGVDNHDARCGKAVRAAMLATFPDTGHKEWMQKPINMPWVMRHFPKAMGIPARCAWYWNAFHESFPDSRNITILRHPYDVVLSSMDYWKVPQRRAWVGIVEMAQVIDHPDSNIDFAISHARLAADPDPEIARLLDHLGLERHPACFSAADKVYVPQRKQNNIPKEELPDHVARGFSRKAEWDRLDMSLFKDREREIVAKMWARFGETLEY
ncbi:sulfotransferase [Halovulum sp. GXIMD14794]